MTRDQAAAIQEVDEFTEGKAGAKARKARR
jgi:hypothetical protein